MKKLSIIVFLLSVFLGVALSANATVLTFDEFIDPNPYDFNYPEVYDGYGGLNWDKFKVIHEDRYSYENGYKYAAVSGTNSAGNFSDMTAMINDGVYNFNGAYFTSAWDANNILTIEGYSSSTMLYSDTFTLSNTSATWFDVNFLGIDKLVFYTSGRQFAMDNFTYNETNPVPEPSTMLLLGMGLVGLAGFGRRKFRKC